MELQAALQRTKSPGQVPSPGQVSSSSGKSGSHKQSPGEVSFSDERFAKRRLSRKPGDVSKVSLLESKQQSKSKRNLFETEEILSRVIQRPGVRAVLFILGILFISAAGGAQTAFHGLTGHVPYTRWKCRDSPDGNTHTKCYNVTHAQSHGDTGGSMIEGHVFNKSTMCDNGMKAGLHFDWETEDHVYFTTDWGLYCNNTYIKNHVVQIFFIGSAFGTLVGGLLYDTIGRRTSVLIGLVIAITSTTMSAFAATAYHMMIFRFFQGMSLFIYYTAAYIYLMEISPPKFRVAVSTLFMVEWSLGTMIELVVFTLVYNWGALLSVMGCLLMLSVLPILYGPDSPRFKLVTLRREAEARKELELLFGMNGDKFEFDTLRGALTFHEQRMDEITGFNVLRLHPRFVRQIGVLLIVWFIVGFSYYGFAYSFSQLSKDILISTLISAAGEMVACLITIPPLLILGRKWSCQFFFLAAGASFVVMMFPFPTFGGGIITIQELTALLGNMAVSGAFSCLYLYTFELTPTTHRGRIFSVCQFVCRIASFLGTKSSALYEKSKFAALVIFAAMSFVCVMVLFTMPMTKNRRTPDVPIEVERGTPKPKERKAQRHAGESRGFADQVRWFSLRHAGESRGSSEQVSWSSQGECQSVSQDNRLPKSRATQPSSLLETAI